MHCLARGIAIAIVVVSLGCGKQSTDPTPTAPVEEVRIPESLPLTAPPGWALQDHPSKQGKVLVAQTKQEGFVPSINLLEENYTGSLDQFVDINLDFLRLQTREFRQLKREPFKTDGGASGIKLTCTSITNTVQLHFTYYLFDWSATTKRVFTCCSLAKHARKMEPQFDEILKTYRPE